MSAKAGSANLITGTRILCSIALLFCQTFSPPFFALYIIAGLTDMIDGTVARKAGTVSEFGAKLDTVADFALVAACLMSQQAQFKPTPDYVQRAVWQSTSFTSMGRRSRAPAVRDEARRRRTVQGSVASGSAARRPLRS